MSQIRIPLFRVLMDHSAIRAATAVLQSGYVGQGPVVDEFELALQEELQLPRRPVTLNSATSGLDLAYRLIGIGPGSKVICTPMTCLATTIPLAHLGAEILWADVDDRGLISTHSVAAIAREHSDIAAVVAVDWGGVPCDCNALRAVAPGVPIIQDAAHSYLTDTSNAGRGDYVVWSFQAIKALTCCDGGALLTPDTQQDRARLLRWYGLDRTKSATMRCNQQLPEIGWKYHMNDLAASIGLANMPTARKGVERSREHARQIIEGVATSARMTVPPFDPHSSYWLLTVLTPPDHQQRFIDHLDSRGIDASPVHARNDQQDVLGAASRRMPGVDRFSSREVCIPCGWWLSESDVERVVDAVLEYDYV